MTLPRPDPLRRLRRPEAPSARDVGAALLVACAVALVAYAASRKAGFVGIAAPLALVIGAILVMRPVVTVFGVVTLVILCEGSQFGIFTFTSHLYAQAYKDISVLDVLVMLAVLSVAIDLVGRRQRLRWPRPLVLPTALLGFAMLVGAVIGHANGTSLRFSIFSQHILAYMFFLPIAVANLDLDRATIKRLLTGAFAIAILKGVLGIIEVAGHLGVPIEGHNTLSYYEPTANWVIMLAIFIALVAALNRMRLSRWMWLGLPVLIGSLVLSYRRSFWIAAVLGIVLALLLASTPTGRRLLVPACLVLGLAIWALSSMHFESQSPVVKRAESLNPSRIESNAEDSYRLDERTNVLAEIAKHPIGGIGMAVNWGAYARPLSVEHEEGRQYVHFAALWYWLKLGILGLCAYVGFIISSLLLAWRAWRRNSDPLLRAFGMASVCAIFGLIAIETTASFTGVDPRFTVLFATQLGLLALLSREPSDLPARAQDSEAEPPGFVLGRSPLTPTGA